MLVKTAFRNLFSARGKTFTIVLLIALGSFLILLSRSVMSDSLRRMHSLSVEKYSGNVFISGVPEKKGIFASLLGPGSVGIQFQSPEMPYLEKKSEIEKKLGSMERVEAFDAGVVSSAGFNPLNLEENFERDEEAKYPYVNLLGADTLSHEAMFGTLSIYEGKIPSDRSEKWLALPRDVRENYEKMYKRKLNIGDEIEGSRWDDKGKKSIRFKVTAFFDYPDKESAVEGIAYADIDSVREIGNLTKGAKVVTEIPEEVDLSLSSMSEDELFSGDISSMLSEGKVSDGKRRDVFSILGDTSERDVLNMADTSAWHYITVRTKNPMSRTETKSVIAELNAFFKENGMKVEAHDWWYAMSMYTIAMNMLKIAYNIVLVILSVVVLIVIMNTLVISAMERTREIGTMRAIGASKAFVGGMFFMEMACMVLAGLFLALILSFAAEAFLNVKSISISGQLSYFFGTKVIRSSLTAADFIKTAFTVGGAAVLSTLYPVAVALRIPPLKAMASE